MMLIAPGELDVVEIGDTRNCILVTGADRGIGLGFVRDYLESGRQVVATSRRPVPTNELAALREEHAGRLLVICLDVAKETSITRFADDVRALGITFGTLISNAGVTVEESFGEWTARTFTTNFLVNTVGPALLVQALDPFLEEGAKLVQISSGMGSIEWNINPENGLDAYAVSKCGLNILSRRLAEKLRPRGIVVCSLNPGWVRTAMGGPDAPASVREAVREMITIIDKIGMDDSGSFLASDGSTIPW